MGWLVQAMAGAETAAVEIAASEDRSVTRTREGGGADDWLCAWCLGHVAREKDRLLHEGRSEFTFLNPQGLRFEIITFSRTIGCRQAGVPTLEHSWFPGHAWSYCLCDRCRIHLGWHYTGPGEFVGLIRDRIIRALLVMS